MTAESRWMWLAVVIAFACSGDTPAAEGPLIVFTAGSLARPMRTALDSFASQTGVRYELESAGSLDGDVVRLAARDRRGAHGRRRGRRDLGFSVGDSRHGEERQHGRGDE